MPVVVSVGLVRDRETGAGQPAEHLVAGRVVVIAAAVGHLAGDLAGVVGRGQRAVGQFHGDVGRRPVGQDGGQAGRDAGPVLGATYSSASTHSRPSYWSGSSARSCRGSTRDGTCGCLRRAWASIPADWSTPVTWSPAASSAGQFLPVPQAASSTEPPWRTSPASRATNAACEGLIVPQFSS